jgi:hypothetical protein
MFLKVSTMEPISARSAQIKRIQRTGTNIPCRLLSYRLDEESLPRLATPVEEEQRGELEAAPSTPVGD